MVLVVLVAISLTAGLAAAAGSARLRPRRPPHIEAGSDMAPEVATGVALVLAIVAIAAGGLVLAVLTFLVRGNTTGIGLDQAAARWGDDHATPFTTDVLDAITFVGQPTSIGVLAALLAVEETVRTRSRWVVPFVLLVVAGNGIVTTTIKHLADRVRPTLNPIAETLGPSFPSGHSSWSAACFAAAALLLSRGRSRHVRIVLAGVGVALAVAIAATRVLLAVHWLSDVLAGLALGWAWFAACSVAFGGRVLRFGATARAAGPGRAASLGRRRLPG